jgi:hypothetical protein
MTTTKDQLILEVWKKTGNDVVRASDLSLIQDALAQRFGTESSPASIARVLADHGALLGHPEILQTDLRWRESDLLFSAEDLTLDNLEAATRLMDKIESLRQQFENNRAMLEHLYQQVRQLKSELQSIHTSLGRELGEWLTVWLQNPGIFKEWLELRRATDEFRQQFGA